MEITETIQKVEEVRSFAANINAELDRCDNGEGMECASLDASLDHYASRCFQLTEQIRLWGRNVFSGRVMFDQLVEEAWFKAGVELNNRAVEMLERARQMEMPCYDLPGANKLGTALLSLYQLLDGWVSARLSVGPSARLSNQLAGQSGNVQKKIAELVPLPADWVPADARQQSIFRKAGKM